MLGGTIGGSLVFDYGFNVETAGDHPVWHRSETDVFPGRQALTTDDVSAALALLEGEVGVRCPLEEGAVVDGDVVVAERGQDEGVGRPPDSPRRSRSRRGRRRAPARTVCATGRAGRERPVVGSTSPWAGMLIAPGMWPARP